MGNRMGKTQKRNSPFSKKLCERLKLKGYRSENGKDSCGIWIKEINKEFDILFHRDWLTFAIRIKPTAAQVKRAKRIIGNKKFDEFNLTKMEPKLQYGIWAFRRFINLEENDVDKAVKAFDILEKYISPTSPMDFLKRLLNNCRLKWF